MGRSKINSKKIEVDGHVFDSHTEAEFYQYLKSRDDVEEIYLQPKFTFIEPFEVGCDRCYQESGKVKSSKTGKLIQCKTCKGTGKRQRQGWTYKADFQVDYKDGYMEIFDVKGFANERFPLVRKMFEHTQKYSLIVVKKKGKEWVRV